MGDGPERTGGSMSTNPQAIQAEYEQRHIDLVRKITEKTRDGRIVWTKGASNIAVTIAGGLQLNFVLAGREISLLPGLAPAGWKSFSVRDAKGNQIVAVENHGVLQNALIGNTGITDIVNQLFSSIMHHAKDDLDKAIDLVDRI
jgi:hypothetical protein